MKCKDCKWFKASGSIEGTCHICLPYDNKESVKWPIVSFDDFCVGFDFPGISVSGDPAALCIKKKETAMKKGKTCIIILSKIL